MKKLLFLLLFFLNVFFVYTTEQAVGASVENI
jgi:hypothetical protein